jgi:uncharacterized membrane protein (UPF0127 family)
MHIISVENKNTPLPTSLQAKYCDDFFSRLRGLMFRHDLGLNEGLLLVQSRESRVDASIHMLFVYMDLAIIWINAEKKVVDTLLARSWKLAYAPHEPAKYILEIHPDRLNEFHIGDQIEFTYV